MAKSGVDRHIKRVSGFCPKCRSIFCDIHSLDSLSRVFQTDKLKVNKCSWMNPLIKYFQRKWDDKNFKKVISSKYNILIRKKKNSLYQV